MTKAQRSKIAAKSRESPLDKIKVRALAPYSYALP